MRPPGMVGPGPSATISWAWNKEVVGGGPSAATTIGGIPSAAMTRGGRVEAIMTGAHGPLSAVKGAGSHLAVITGGRCPSPRSRTAHQA